MAYTTIETIALVIIAFGLVKMVVLLVNPKVWMDLAKKLWSNIGLMQIVMLALSGFLLYLLINNGISITQIFAVMAFMAALMAVGFAPHVESLVNEYNKQIKKGSLFKDNWLYLLIWIALLLWGAKEILM
ncbi:hypothetical protein BMS3Abin17_00501 [archaeon BMS3Abin17]|nr:hypothetical protein BMS3Abin17_00501 [archaeon BMS3Abin17]HDZ61062.1 hypothetical protein [Candidatus Pacearchaeota archaeon]